MDWNHAEGVLTNKRENMKFAKEKIINNGKPPVLRTDTSNIAIGAVALWKMMMECKSQLHGPLEGYHLQKYIKYNR